MTSNYAYNIPPTYDLGMTPPDTATLAVVLEDPIENSTTSLQSARYEQHHYQTPEPQGVEEVPPRPAAGLSRAVHPYPLPHYSERYDDYIHDHTVPDPTASRANTGTRIILNRSGSSTQNGRQ